MHGHGLFKIQLALYQCGLTSYLQKIDVTINKSKNKRHEITILPQKGRIEQQLHKRVTMGKNSWELVQTRDRCQVFQEM